MLLRSGHETSDFLPLIEYLKSLSPAGVDLEIRSLDSRISDGHFELSDFVAALASHLRSKQDFETIMATEKPSQPDHNCTLPARASSPDDVRRYIVEVLTTRYDVSADVASENARRWRIGRGHEFLDASGTVLRDIFGAELGYILEQNVAEDIRRTWQGSIKGRVVNRCML